IGSIFFFFYPLSQNVFFTVGIRTAQCCFLAVIVLTYAMLAEHMPKEIGKSMGDANFSIGIGWLIGGGLSGFIYATNALLFFYFCGFISIISSIAFLFITEEKKGRIFILTSPFSLNRILEIRILCLLAFFLLTANYIIYGIFPVYMKHLGLKTEFIGILYGLSGLTGIPAVWYAGRLCDRIGRRPILFFSIFIYLFIWLCFAITENTIIISILWLIPAWSLFAPSTIAMVTDMTDEKERGRGLGLLNGSIYIGGFVGALLGGYIVDKFNFNFAFIIASFLVVLALVVGMKTKETYKTNC
ncbi:MAG: MFS transporter, partial [Candidatus Thermoplasmatota archaeon]